MNPFERYLTLWVALCIVAGVALGSAMPGPFHLLGDMSLAQVNIPVAVLIWWLMIVPMLLRVDFTSMGQVARHRRGIAVTLGVNRLGSRARHRLAWSVRGNRNSKIGTSAFAFPVAIARRLRSFHTADLLGERLLDSRSDRLRFPRWLSLLGHPWTACQGCKAIPPRGA